MTYPTREQHLVAHMRVAIVFGSPENAAICKCGFGRGLHLDDYDARERAWVEHVAETWDDAMTVTTRAELDALPDGTVVIADDGHVRLLCHRERSWVPLPARILHLPNPASGTTTPETPAEPPQEHTGGKNDALSISPEARIADLTVGQAVKAAEVFLEGVKHAATMQALESLWDAMFGGKR